MRAGGLDPSASPRRPSGAAMIALGRGGPRLEWAALLSGDDEIVSALRGADAVAVDSPLSLPSSGALREVDRELIRMGHRVLPPAWRGMRELAARSISIVGRLGARAIETHPRSALASSGCCGVGELLGAAGVAHGPLPASRDALDAVVAAVVAMEALEGRSLVVRAPDGEVHLSARLCRGSGGRPPGRTSSSRRSWPGPPRPSPPPS